jgi:hypothetical protein
VDYLGTRRLMTIARRQAAEVRHTPCNFANGFDRPADVYVPRD